VADEIERAKPRAGELEQLDGEARRLGHAEELGRVAEELAQLLDGDDRAASSALGHSVRLVAVLERIDPEGAADGATCSRPPCSTSRSWRGRLARTGRASSWIRPASPRWSAGATSCSGSIRSTARVSNA